MKTKDITDKQIQEQINALEEENRNTRRLSMGRGHGWGDDAMERRRNKILRLNSILFARRVEKKKQKPKIPTGMALQKSLTKSGGQMHFKNGGGKKKPKTLSAKKTKKRVKRIKKGSDNLMTFGVRIPSVKTLEDLIK